MVLDRKVCVLSRTRWGRRTKGKKKVCPRLIKRRSRLQHLGVKLSKRSQTIAQGSNPAVWVRWKITSQWRVVLCASRRKRCCVIEAMERDFDTFSATLAEWAARSKGPVDKFSILTLHSSPTLLGTFSLWKISRATLSVQVVWYWRGQLYIAGALNRCEPCASGWDVRGYDKMSIWAGEKELVL